MKKIIGVLLALFFSVSSVFAYNSYVSGTDYSAGSQVINGSKIYECLSAPNSGWCDEGGFYEPGVGKYWRNAWKEIGDVTSTTQVTNNTAVVNSSFVIDSNVFTPTKTIKTISKKTIYPAKPSLSVLSKSYTTGNYNITWTVPTDGILGDTVQLIENGIVIATDTINPNSTTKAGSFTIDNQSTGTFKYHVVMCLKGACSSSGNTQITVYNGGKNTSYTNTPTTNIYALPSDVQRIIDAASTLSGTPTVDTTTLSNNRENVKKVMGIFPESKWNELFPVADGIYSYQKFLQTVAKFPKFCGEVGDYSGYDSDTICRKEVATLLTLYSYESGVQSTNSYTPGNTSNYPLWKQGLYYTQIPGANTVNSGNYFGRGSLLLSGIDAYKYLSLALYENDTTLTNEPNKVSNDGYTSLASGMWYYMTPKNQSPSIHDIVTGFWKPTANEVKAGLEQGFGAVIQTINPSACNGSGTETTAAERYITYYKEFANALLVSPGASLSCKNQPSIRGANYPISQYFWNPNNSGDCTLSSTQSNYYVFQNGSYEACKKSTSSSTISNPVITPTIPSIVKPIPNISNSSIESSIPNFKALPRDLSFNQFGTEVEKELVKQLKNKTLTKNDIIASIGKFDIWIDYLTAKNKTNSLTGTQKRTLIILMMMRDMYKKYD